MGLTQVPRFIAPHFIEIEGSADIPGPVRRACSFTTAAPGWPRDADGATHRHRCELRSLSGRWQEAGPVAWRTETWPCVESPAEPVQLSDGTAPDLIHAIAAALGAAHMPPRRREASRAAVLCVAPGFVEMQREAGLPRIWVSAHLSAAGAVSTTQPWTHLLTAFIREWPGHRGGGFRCELETLPYAAVMPGLAPAAAALRETLCWEADSLEDAMQGCLSRIFAPRVVAPEPGFGAD
ncbi:hypothetical protein [Pseudoroseomonas cervicalis]|uniref:hypothetical protein n=1 Tax=Teichococcus cervicalis TaxID=204525 RepID=UPI0022F17897|nr:hypothetical protein [Pseudoroseomonas cervicalis]WBV45452.1 hypothetical protein PFY06_21475 [Pseudoroseomonas cervicalis]